MNLIPTGRLEVDGELTVHWSPDDAPRAHCITLSHYQQFGGEWATEVQWGIVSDHDLETAQEFSLALQDAVRAAVLLKSGAASPQLVARSFGVDTSRLSDAR